MKVLIRFSSSHSTYLFSQEQLTLTAAARQGRPAAIDHELLRPVK